MAKTRIEGYERKALSTAVSGYIKKHPHHTLVKATRRYGVTHAAVAGHEARLRG